MGYRRAGPEDRERGTTATDNIIRFGSSGRIRPSQLGDAQRGTARAKAFGKRKVDYPELIPLGFRGNSWLIAGPEVPGPGRTASGRPAPGYPPPTAPGTKPPDPREALPLHWLP